MVTESPYLLVVDDDQRLRELLFAYLQENGFRVQAASNAAQARAHLASQKFDLIILDIMMPGEDGLQLTENLRKGQSTPILLLTARDQLDDRIVGFEAGADDYLSKPFEPRELVMRIKAILRRVAQTKDQSAIILQLGIFSFNTQTNQLRNNQETIFLSSTELILLKTLAMAPRQPFARTDLAQRIGHRVSERTVDVQITRLRRKINENPRAPRYLQTVRHVGYALWPDE
jgi:two-component system phosphate regulon response regulator OmpR